MRTHIWLLFFLLAAVARAVDTGQKMPTWRATPIKPLPRDQQKLGYQFYSALPIREWLRAEIMENYALLGELEEAPEEPSPFEVILSHAVFDITKRESFENMREEAASECRRYTKQLADPCTRAVFSPFELVCELTIVVTRYCIAKREQQPLPTTNAVYNEKLAEILTNEKLPTCFHDDDGSEKPSTSTATPRTVVVPLPQQQYEDFLERRTVLRRAARNLSRS